MALELSCESPGAGVVKRCRAGSISMTEAIYPSETSVPPHYHPTASLCLVLAGGYEERFRASSFLCDAGTLVFSVPGEVHSDRFGPNGGRCFTVSFPEPLLLAWATDGCAHHRRTSRQGAPSRYAFELLTRFGADVPLGRDTIEELVLAILDDVHSRPSVSSRGRPPGWLIKVRDRVHDGFRNLASLQELADDAGVHRVHAAREFRRHFDCTIGDYARRRRVERACSLLTDPAADLATVACAVGFADQAHMTRAFRSVLDTTPGRFHARYRA